MSQDRRFLLWRCTVAAAWLSLLWYPSVLSAQHTTVEKNGSGGKIETDYNVANKATEMRTIGADGKLQQKVDYEYLPGYYGAQQTDTTYWPGGKVRKVVRHTYDASSNFAGEFIQQFDDSGKQIAGHQLTHDPMTGIYRCLDWDAGARNYRQIVCPKGEEESGRNTPQKFTYEEIMAKLDAARTTAIQEQKVRRRLPMTPIRPPITIQPREVGLILPAEFSRGQRVSGSIVENPERYDGMPGITIARITIPFESAGEASRLFGWQIEVTGEEPQIADGSISFVAPSANADLKVTLRQSGNPEHSVEAFLSMRPQNAPRVEGAFQAPALCMKAELCRLTGPFYGDSRKTFVSFGDQPATIVAENESTVYLAISDVITTGLHPLLIAEELKVAAVEVTVGDVEIKDNGRNLQAGETALMTATIDGVGDLPDAAWTANKISTEELARIHRLVPGYQPRKSKPDEHDSNERSGGEILLVLKNPAPDRFSLRGASGGMLIFHLSDESFERGDFKYNIVLEARQSGKAELKVFIIPLLAPVRAKEFTAR